MHGRLINNIDTPDEEKRLSLFLDALDPLQTGEITLDVITDVHEDMHACECRDGLVHQVATTPQFITLKQHNGPTALMLTCMYDICVCAGSDMDGFPRARL
jgi:hypothetical protein